MTEKEFNIYVLRVRERLIRFASGFCRGGALTPEDMVQEAITKVWRLNGGNIELRSVEAVTITVLKNVCLDYIKLKKNNTEKLEKEEVFKRVSDRGPLEVLEGKESMRQVIEYMQLLSPEQQIVLRLRDILGYELEEIATIVDTTPGNVRVLLSRARGRMRELLINER